MDASESRPSALWLAATSSSSECQAGCHARRVLHSAGRKVGHAEDTQLLERVLGRVIAVEERQVPLRRFQCKPCQVVLVGGRAHADGNGVGRALAAHEIAHRESDEIVDIFGVVSNPPCACAAPARAGRK